MHFHDQNAEHVEIPVSAGMSTPVKVACFMSLALIIFMVGITAASSRDLHVWPWTDAMKILLKASP